MSEEQSPRFVQALGGAEVILDALGYPLVAPAVSGGGHVAGLAVVWPPPCDAVTQPVVLGIRSGSAELITGDAVRDLLFGALDLEEALADAEECVAEAREEAVAVPSAVTIARSKALLRKLYRIRPCRFEVYPLRAGEVAIDAPGPYGRSVLVVCEPDGGAVCSVNLDGYHRRAVYDAPTAKIVLPDGFVREALQALDA